MNRNTQARIFVGGLRLCVITVLMALALFMPGGLAGAATGTTTIGGCIYTGASDANGDPIFAPSSLTPPRPDAKVMVQNQHSGGAFITYGTVDAAGCWTADVPLDGDYVVMFSAPNHDLTSREVKVSASGQVTHPKRTASGIVTSTSATDIDAYLPPLPLPKANLLVYAFYDNVVNGEPDDYPEDIPLNGVTWTIKDEDGNVLATGVTGSQSAITASDGTVVCDNAVTPGSCYGLYYFTGLPPGEVIATSSADKVHLYPQFPEVAALGFDANTQFYLDYTEEGGPAWDPKLYPGDPGTEAGAFLIWHGYVAKLGQIGEPTNPTPYNPNLVGSISGTLLDADGNDPAEPFPVPGPPGVSPNTAVPDGLVILFTDGETVPTHPVATTEADPVTGEFSFINVPPGRYKMMNMDVPLDYVWTQSQVTVLPGITTTISPMLPRFFARAWGHVYDNSTTPPTPMSNVNVHIRYKDGSIQMTQTTDTNGWYRFDDLPEIEVMGYVDAELPPHYRGAVITDTFAYNLTSPYTVTHNAMNRYIQWYTLNYTADLYLEPIPATEGDIRGVVFYDHLAKGTWVGDGLYDPKEERTMHGVTVELWDATGTTLLDTTTTGKFDKAATLAQGWHEPYTMPPDELGGVYVGPMPGFYEFRGLAPGTYKVKVIPPAGFSPSSVDYPSGEATVTVTGGLGTEVNLGVTTLVPLAGEIEGGVFDDVNIDNRATSLLFAEKAGVDHAPIGVYDHLGYLLGVGDMGNPLCYAGSTVCPPGEEPIQKPEMERRFAPGVHIYVGNDPALPGYNPNFLPLTLPYTFGQGKFKFEADWSLVPTAFLGPGVPLAGAAAVLPGAGPVVNNVAPGGSYIITGANFGDVQGHSTVTLSGRELAVISWSDTEIHVQDTPHDVAGPLIVTTWAGPSNGMHVDIQYDPRQAPYMASRSVYVDASNTGFEDGSQAHPWNTITEALNNLPSPTPRYVFVAPGTYNERIRITESDIQLIGAGPKETIIDGLGPVSTTSQGFSNGGGPVITIGAGGMDGGVSNIVISGFTITGGTVNGDDIGAGIFGDYGNRNIDINNNIIVRNGGYYGGGIWLHKSNHDVKIWSNVIAENGNFGGYGGGISVNDEPEYPEGADGHGEPEHVRDDHCPPTCAPPGTYEIYNNYIHHNYSPDYGGGIALYEVKDHLMIYGNVIEENKAEDHGGGAFFEDTGPIDLYGNKFLRNFCYDDGGAVGFEDVADDISIIKVYDNLFAENMVDDHGENHARGGALAFDDTFYAEVYNNTIVNNVAAGSADPAGGGIDSERNGHEYNGSDPAGRDIAPGFSDPKIYNNIICGNQLLHYDQPIGGEEEDLDYTWGSNYVWTPDELHVDNPALQAAWESHNNSESFTYVAYNDICDGSYAGRVGNINVDPGFVDPATGDWHLGAGSPLVDQAPASTAPATDLDVLPRRPVGGMVDIGAYEIQPAVVPSGDVNWDCNVNVIDIMSIASRWGLWQGDPNYEQVYDVNLDGMIDAGDIQAVVAQWREGCVY
ncbi:MAG: hypothetical protein D6791_13750 [Chloroflexi bacterium]|nr:MAG: hypothetical protein D6791_13750 [Chloroflexota bacterium]